jgi:hypothetical protein
MTHRYDPTAVNAAIRQSRERIGSREARMIHRLLAGRSFRDTNTTKGA